MSVLAVVKHPGNATAYTFFSIAVARKWAAHPANALHKMQVSHYSDGRHIATVFIGASMLGDSMEAWQAIGGEA